MLLLLLAKREARGREIQMEIVAAVNDSSSRKQHEKKIMSGTREEEWEGEIARSDRKETNEVVWMIPVLLLFPLVLFSLLPSPSPSSPSPYYLALLLLVYQEIAC